MAIGWHVTFSCWRITLVKKEKKNAKAKMDNRQAITAKGTEADPGAAQSSN